VQEDVELPEAQEISSMPCNVGFPREELEVQVPKLFEGASRRINYSVVADGWNSKVSRFILLPLLFIHPIFGLNSCPQRRIKF
jgi:hypothetical protein